MLEDLKTVHKLPYGEKLCKELLREIVFYNLPSEVKIELINACGSNYPDIDEISDKYNQVIRKLNITDFSNSQSSKEKTKPNASNVQ